MPAAPEDPASSGFGRRSGHEHRRPASLAIAAAAGLTVLALFVAFFLPDYVRTAPPSPSPASSPPVSAPAPRAEPATSPVPDAARAGAENLVPEMLRRMARLEGDGVRQWGRDPVQDVSLPAAEEIVAKATSHLDRQEYREALPLLRQAIEALDKLTESKPERLRQAQTAGRAALAALDAEAAQRHLEIAAALTPGDAQAASLLERARKLPQVLAAFRQGESAEAAGDLNRARTAYRAAASLDPEFEDVRVPSRRVEAALAAAGYRSAVSETLARLNDGNARAAEAAFERARRANPQGPELADLRQRVHAASQLAALERLRGQAEGLERQEKWDGAARLYEQALVIDGAASFAVRGREQAQRLVQLHAAIDTYLADPARLQSADPLANAKSLLAQKVENEGPILSAKRQRLTQLVTAAQTPLPVLLRSDRNTEVTVQRVGAFGAFESRRLELPPGRYVAVGSRPGYRDVRVTFEVSSAAAEQSVTIQCTEPIR
jgi:tetratricopeptide (TPR) repeat protein